MTQIFKLSLFSQHILLKLASLLSLNGFDYVVQYFNIYLATTLESSVSLNLSYSQLLNVQLWKKSPHLVSVHQLLGC